MRANETDREGVVARGKRRCRDCGEKSVWMGGCNVRDLVLVNGHLENSPLPGPRSRSRLCGYA